jgi:hypothetical protein
MDAVHVMYAADAKAIAEKARQPVNPWTKLFDHIKQQAELGHSKAVFNEEEEGVRFAEDRTEVKDKLEHLGYSVGYRREADADSAYYAGRSYHNVYTIYW